MTVNFYNENTFGKMIEYDVRSLPQRIGIELAVIHAINAQVARRNSGNPNTV